MVKEASVFIQPLTFHNDWFKDVIIIIDFNCHGFASAFLVKDKVTNKFRQSMQKSADMFEVKGIFLTNSLRNGLKMKVNMRQMF